VIKALQLANLGLRFGLELGALGLVSYWGFHALPGGLSRLVLAMAAPLALAVLWGLLASPRARVTLSQPLKVGVQVTLLLVPAAALAQAGRPALASAFAGVVVINAVLLERWRQ
jgi:hypothetical protein